MENKETESIYSFTVGESVVYDWRNLRFLNKLKISMALIFFGRFIINSQGVIKKKEK